MHVNIRTSISAGNAHSFAKRVKTSHSHPRAALIHMQRRGLARRQTGLTSMVARNYRAVMAGANRLIRIRDLTRWF
ncbi:MAG: hypothetical protein AAFO79_05725, partial [Pseudomonadota bacterium]